MITDLRSQERKHPHRPGRRPSSPVVRQHHDQGHCRLLQINTRQKSAKFKCGSPRSGACADGAARARTAEERAKIALMSIIVLVVTEGWLREREGDGIGLDWMSSERLKPMRGKPERGVFFILPGLSGVFLESSFRRPQVLHTPEENPLSEFVHYDYSHE